MIRRGQTLLASTLWLCLVFVGGCTSATDTADGPAISATTARRPIDSCVDDPASSDTESADLLVLGQEEAATGETIRFHWDVEADAVITSAYWIVASCWNGTAWTGVWGAQDIYRTPIAWIVDESIAPPDHETLAWNDHDGEILIPESVPPGTYRMTASVCFEDREAPEPCTEIPSTADLVVTE